MLTSAKIGRQNGDTRTRKPESGYLNLSNDCPASSSSSEACSTSSGEYLFLPSTSGTFDVVLLCLLAAFGTRERG